MHSSIQTTDQIYGLFKNEDIKERLHGLSNPEDINLLNEVPPKDRQFILDLYRVYKEKHSD